MSPAQRLVNRIREFVTGYDQEPSPAIHDMAQQYADLCRSLNERLIKCSEFLEKGMRSEAVQEALEPPSVFSLSTTLDFEELKNWRNLCLDLGMTAPPDIDQAAVQRLQDECGTEQLLEPLLYEFRRLVHKGTAEERIRVLRQIRSYDAANQVWQENLEPLEREQMDVVVKAAEAALKEDDVSRVRELYEDMTVADRLVDAPRDLLAKMERRLREQRAAAALEEGDNIVRHLQKALEQNDFTAAEALAGKWRRLLKYEDFHPAVELMDQAAEGLRKVEAEIERREREQQYDAAMVELKRALRSADTAPEELERGMRRLASFGNPVPGELRAAVEQRMAAEAERKLRRRRARMQVTVAALLLMMIAAAAATMVMMRRNEVKETQRTLATLWQKGQYQQLLSYLERLQNAEPALYRRAEVQAYRQQVEEVMAQEEQRQKVWQEMLDKLSNIRAAGYSATAPLIERLLEDAGRVAVGSEQENSLANWRREWELWREREQQRMENEFKRVTDALRGKLRGIEQALKNEAPGLVVKLLNEADAGVQEAKGLVRKVSAESQEALTTLQNELLELQQKLAAREAAIKAAAEKRQRILDGLTGYMPDMKAYETALREFVEAFPQDPRTPQFRRVLNEMPAYQDAMAGNAFKITAMPVKQAALDQIDAVLAGLAAAENSIWYRDLTVCRDYAVRNQEAREGLGRIRMMPFFEMKKFRVRPHGAEKWQTIFYPNKLYSRQTEVEGTPVTLYWGQVYVTDAETYAPRLEHLNYNSREYEIETGTTDQHNLVPSAKAARELLVDAGQAELLDSRLLQSIGKLLADEQLAPLPKAALIKYLATQLDRISPFTRDYAKRIAIALEGVDVDMSWINNQHPRIQKMQEMAISGLNRIPPPAEALTALEFNRWLLLTALGRGVRSAGIMAAETVDAAALTPAVTGPQPQVLWSVIPAAAGRAAQFEVMWQMSEAKEALLKAAGARPPYFGQILLAPGDGLTTAELLRKGPPAPAPEAIVWPHAWPINGRQVPQMPVDR